MWSPAAGIIARDASSWLKLHTWHLSSCKSPSSSASSPARADCPTIGSGLGRFGMVELWNKVTGVGSNPLGSRFLLHLSDWLDQAKPVVQHDIIRQKSQAQEEQRRVNLFSASSPSVQPRAKRNHPLSPLQPQPALGIWMSQEVSKMLVKGL